MVFFTRSSAVSATINSCLYATIALLFLLPMRVIAEQAYADFDMLIQETTKGDALSEYELAIKYELAIDLEANLSRAFALYCRSARKGYNEAMFHVGWMYLTGLGTRRDIKMAAAWLQQAAEQGSADARRTLRIVALNTSSAAPKCNPYDGTAISAVIRTLGPSYDVEQVVRSEAPSYGLDPQLVLAVAAVESGFDRYAVSPKNAQGIMQLIPETARRFGVSNPYDIRDNLRGGMKYLQYLLGYFNGNIKLALAGYNAGEGAVIRYGGVPPYAETINYIEKVMRAYRKMTF